MDWNSFGLMDWNRPKVLVIELHGALFLGDKKKKKKTVVVKFFINNLPLEMSAEQILHIATLASFLVIMKCVHETDTDVVKTSHKSTT